MNNERNKKIINGFLENIVLKSDFKNPLWNSENRVFSKENKWNYIDGCMIKALTGLFESTGESRLFKFSRDYTDNFISDNNKIDSININAYNLDNINGGKNLLYFYRRTGDKKYIETSRWIFEKQLRSQPRLECGNFWHKLIYPHQIWLDGIYMCLPFLAEYAAIENRPEISDDIKNQLKNVREIMRNKDTGLYYHAYDETRGMYWADKKTGLSQEYWLRSIGWLMAGLADIFEITQDTDLKMLSGDMLEDLISAMIKYQNCDGTFCQLPAKAYLSGNYPETSGTALYAYSALKAARLGICGEEVRSSGVKAFEGIIKNYVCFEGDMPVLNNICLVAGLGGDKHRNGSEKYYLEELVVKNDAKGIAPLIMSYTETL